MAFIDKFKSKWGQTKGTKTPSTEKKKRTSKNIGDVSGNLSDTTKQQATVSHNTQGTVCIVQPHVTEKTAVLASHGKYTFIVARWANKLQVGAAIKAKYGILPTSIHMMNQRGKHVRFGGKYGRQTSWKKAVVTLPKGKTLEIYEGV